MEKISNGGKFAKGHEEAEGDNENVQDSAVSQKANEYIKELLAEKVLIEEGKMPNALRLLDQEVTKVQTTGKPFRDTKFVNVYRDKPTKVVAKVLVPSREYPKFNFIGQLLGPKGSSMKRLQEETMCRMTILGKGSMKDHAKEEELRNSLDPKYSHLSDNLHVEISAVAPPAEAHARIAFALAEIRKYLVPELAENIRQEQFREVEYSEERPRRPPPSTSRPASSRPPPSSSMRPPNRGPPRGVAPPPKTRMSGMNRHRSTLEDNYGYDDDYDTPHSYNNYNSPRSNNYDEYDDYNNGGNSNYEAPNRPWKSSPFSKPTTRPPALSRQFDGPRYKSSPYSRPLK